MKKIVAVVAILVVIGGFVVFQKLQSGSSVATGTPGPNLNNLAYKDGVYTGQVASASMYGDIQLKVTIAGGKITSVDAIKFPNTPGHTTEVSNKSLPILKQEVIAAQSAKIDNVSGATQTTEGFIQSLQSALDQAKG